MDVKVRTVTKLNFIIAILVMLLSLLISCKQDEYSVPLYSKPPEAGTNEEKKTETAVPLTSISPQSNDWKIIETFFGKESSSNPVFHVPYERWRISCKADAGRYENAIFNIFLYRAGPSDGLVKKITCISKESVTNAYPGVGSGDYYIKVIAANLDSWVIAIEAHTEEETQSPVRIVMIDYSGKVYPTSGCQCYERIEPDEYVLIKNISDSWQDVRGWLLLNATKGYPSFIFPDYFPCVPAYFSRYYKSDFSDVPAVPCILGPQQSVVIYTDELHSETGCLSFNYGTTDIWDNERPNVAVLYNAFGKEVSRKSYTTTIID